MDEAFRPLVGHKIVVSNGHAWRAGYGDTEERYTARYGACVCGESFGQLYSTSDISSLFTAHCLKVLGAGT